MVVVESYNFDFTVNPLVSLPELCYACETQEAITNFLLIVVHT